MNSAFLLRYGLGTTVTGISMDPATWVVKVMVSADLSSLISVFLPFDVAVLPGVTWFDEHGFHTQVLVSLKLSLNIFQTQFVLGQSD